MTDKECLDEFVKRLNCEAAVLIYLDKDAENPEMRVELGFSKWKTPFGKQWSEELLKQTSKRENVTIITIQTGN